jgi:hypothetical protein
MVPTSALADAAATYVGHEWGKYAKRGSRSGVAEEMSSTRLTDSRASDLSEVFQTIIFNWPRRSAS